MGNQIDKVLPGLYVGGFLGEFPSSWSSVQYITTIAGHLLSPGTDGKKKLQEHKITHILAIHDTAEPEHTVSITLN